MKDWKKAMDMKYAWSDIYPGTVNLWCNVLGVGKKLWKNSIQPIGEKQNQSKITTTEHLSLWQLSSSKETFMLILTAESNSWTLISYILVTFSDLESRNIKNCPWKEC